jgi:hypothetical protein
MQASEYFRTHTPSKPYSTNDLERGLRIRSREIALKQRYLQPNHPSFCQFLAFDIDRAGGAFAAEDANLPHPSFVVITPHNRHAHLLYALETPVFMGDAARSHPIDLLAAIQRTMGRRMGADMGYCGLITKNPLHDYWLQPYSLDAPIRTYTLQDFYDELGLLDPKQKPTETTGYGRNSTVFEGLKAWAYVAVRRHRGGLRRDNFALWQAECLDKAGQLNGSFANPLGHGEIRQIARSVAKWCWKKDPEAEAKFSKRQSERGKLAGVASGKVRQAQNEDKRVSARLMRIQGLTHQQIADELGVTDRTIRNWLSDNLKSGNEP